MEFKDLIQIRRSIRSYKSAPAHDDLIHILTQAQQAPSWRNQQTSRCYVIEDPEALERIRPEILPAGNCKNSANAALIVTTYVKDTVGFKDSGEPVNEVGNGWGAYDLGLHDAYLILAASNAGYSTLIMGLRDADAIRRELAIPETETIMSVIAIGMPDQEPAMRPRKPFDEVVRFI